MAPKKSTLKALPRKGVSRKKADAVKGGVKPQGPRISLNHNLVVR